MSLTLTTANPAARRVRKDISFQTGLRIQIQGLLAERDCLEEEIRQLRAAVQIYSEIARRTAPAPLRAA